MIDRGELKTYVDGSLYLAAKKRDSAFNRQFKNERNQIPVTDNMIIKPAFMGARLENETLDARISRLKPAQAKLFRAYILPDFNKVQYAQAAGTSVGYITDELLRIKKYMKGLVSRIVKTEPDIEFHDGGLKMIADIEGKVLYIGGSGSVDKECRMCYAVGKVLREKHGINDFDAWQTFHCTSEDKIFVDKPGKVKVQL